MLPEAAGRWQHFQARGHSFSLYGPTLRRPITFLSFSSCRKLAYKSFTSGFVYTILPLNRLTRRLQYKPFAKNLTSKRANKSNTIRISKDVLKSRFLSNYFMLVHLVPYWRSPKLFSRCEISCKVWSWTTKTFFFSIIVKHSTELDFSTVNWVANSEEIR